MTEGTPVIAGLGLDDLSTVLTPQRFAPGDVLLQEGSRADRFFVLVDGTVSVRHTTADGQSRVIGSAGRGSLLGEIALLSGGRRTATAIADDEVHVLAGDAAAFDALVALPEVGDALVRIATVRLAEGADPVTIHSRTGEPVGIRPLLPGDRSELAAAIEALSPRSRRMRFFTNTDLPPAVIDHLADIDYRNHFAWVAFTEPEHGIGVSRSVRLPDDETVVEISVALDDDHQGLGLGGPLLGAAAVAAAAQGAPTIEAHVLRSNEAMKRIFRRAGAEWTADADALTTRLPTEAIAALIDPEPAAALRAVADRIVRAAAIPHLIEPREPRPPT